MTDTLSIIIVTYNNNIMLDKCLNSISKYTTLPYKIIVHNNGNSPQTSEVIKKYAHTIETTSDTNIGFVKANNDAMLLVDDLTKYVILLNDDTEITGPGWARMLIEPFKNFLIGATGKTGMVLRPDSNAYPIRNQQNIDYIEGYCLCFPKILYDTYGLFDYNIKFAYCEDSDFSLMLRSNGFSIQTMPKLPIIHHGSTVRRQLERTKTYNFNIIERNNQAYISKKWKSYLINRVFDKKINNKFKICISRRAARGDVLLTFPIVKQIKLDNPKADVWYATDPACMSILKGCKYIDKVIGYPISNDNLHIINKVVELKYEHNPVNYMGTMAEYAGIHLNDKKLFYEYDIKALDIANGIINNKPSIVFHTGRSWPMREWDIYKFIEVAKFLKESGYQVLEIGDGGTKLTGHGIDCRSKSIDIVAALLQKSKLFIGIDSLPLHIAKAVGTPTMGIYGATLPHLVESDGPSYPIFLHLPCIGCRHRIKKLGDTTIEDFPCKVYKCMNDLPTSMVIDRLKSLINTHDI